jgi:hypothetical protein
VAACAMSSSSPATAASRRRLDHPQHGVADGQNGRLVQAARGDGTASWR